MRSESETTGSGRLESRRVTRLGELNRLRRRYRRDRRFKAYAMAAIVLAAAFLVFFLADLVRRGSSALHQTELRTAITYNDQTVNDPTSAFPKEVRDLVSYSRVREVRREGKRAEINVPVTYGDSIANDPASAINDFKLTDDDLPFFMSDLAPSEVPRTHLLAMIDRDALEEIRSTLAETPSLAGTTRRQWLRGSRALQQFLTDSTGLDEEVHATADLMDHAGMLRTSFNRAEFGDGRTIEQWVLADADVDQYVKGRYSEIGYLASQYEAWMRQIDQPLAAKPDLETVMAGFDRLADVPVEQGSWSRGGPPTREQLELAAEAWDRRQRIDKLRDNGHIELVFNRYFFLNGDSKLPEAAGLRSAILGSIYVLGLVFVICVPIGVLTSIYLEEFAPDNWLTQIIEVNINNLAAIPSILFGVLGLAALINFFGIPRASVLVGGATLALMTLPIIIISSRAALRAVPDSIRMAGFAMGATRWQVVTQHVLPASISGILTGAIIGIAQAMGETAPLIIVGLVAFVPDAPLSPMDAATVMPAQIFSWWEMPQRAFEERAALAILLLLLVLFAINAVALVIRTRSEKRW